MLSGPRLPLRPAAVSPSPAAALMYRTAAAASAASVSIPERLSPPVSAASALTAPRFWPVTLPAAFPVPFLLSGVPAFLRRFLPAWPVSAPGRCAHRTDVPSGSCSVGGKRPQSSFSVVPAPLRHSYSLSKPQQPASVQMPFLRWTPVHLSHLTDCFSLLHYSSAKYLKPLYLFFLNPSPIHSPSHSLPPFLIITVSLQHQKIPHPALPEKPASLCQWHARALPFLQIQHMGLYNKYTCS